jgi:CHAT domain-containing protein
VLLRDLPVQPPASNDRLRFVGIGNPQPLPPGWAPLPFAHMEVEQIAARFPASERITLYDRDATRASVEKLLERQPIHLHFACHGQFDPLAPLDSGLALAAAHAQAKSDGIMLTLRDLLSQKWLSGTRLVVLSACQTALTEMRRTPDEAIGLPAGFLQAGAAAVIGSLWQVRNVSTTLLMERFYHHLYPTRSGELQEAPVKPAQALCRAQQWLRRVSAGEVAARLDDEIERLGQGDHPVPPQLIEAWEYFASLPDDVQDFVDPFYWAAFSYTGA